MKDDRRRGDLARVLAALTLVLLAVILPSRAQKLNGYNIDANDLSVVGVSSGGAMAVQMHVAFSRTVKGAGIIAGTPYWCAQGDVDIALTSCMAAPDLIDLSVLWDGTAYAYNMGSIDNTKYMQNSRVWLFSGQKDTIVDTGVVKKAKMYYEYYITNASSVAMVTNISSEHAWITNNYGNACDYLGSPYINNCNFDASGAMLRHFYPQSLLNPRAAATNATNIFTFNQQYYTPASPASISMGQTGYVYVANACQQGALCKLVVAFHGCEMSIPDIKDAYYVHSGLNEWAETNNMIVLYPQAIKSSDFPYNPKGCWDWWGYTGEDYATQAGPQMAAIKNMINALARTQ